ncbi:SDR family oxidoreductase [Dactylosporangium vinaceum]|uniref:SDR family NAD(P)-dependent oxidoreductase n=1 Tax=Dactylosporangium vinaceum TaxID=53362 RepID=A0ABV5M4W5_9ACTN|nr:SDR family NAD(P)-dependent oxidoreductase [Dactylosporangium vinaceum]
MSRTVVITGASAGIGLAAARRFAAQGDRLILLGRDERRLAAAGEETGATTVRADFGDLDQVRTAARAIRDACERIDVLVNNAGGLYRGPKALVVNHLAGFRLAHELLDRLYAAGTSRIVTTASLAEAWGVLNVDDPLRPSLWHRARWLSYGSSKQANILFTQEAARRWGAHGVLPVAFFPGLVRSRFASSSPLFMLAKPVPVLFASPDRAAGRLQWLADAPAAELVPGGYYFLRELFPATPRSTSPDRAARLWESSLRV